MWSGSEEGSYSRLIDCCIAQSNEEEEDSTLAELPLAWWPSAAAGEVWRGADLKRMALKTRSDTPSVACAREGKK